jgi:hypothetical protein
MERLGLLVVDPEEPAAVAVAYQTTLMLAP